MIGAARAVGEPRRGRRWEGSGVETFNGVKVFTATRAKDREELGEAVTRWLRQSHGIELVDKVVTQSSDQEFHCLTITLFYRDPTARP